jgi:hypothetical protein
MTSELVASRAAEAEVPGWGFGAVFLDGEDVYWMEGRPQQEGRCVVMRVTRDGEKEELTPPAFNVRTRVHEYGGAAYTVDDGTVIFSNFPRPAPLSAGARGQPVPITPRTFRYADGVVDRARRRLICIREITQPGAARKLPGRHRPGGRHPPQVLSPATTLPPRLA